MSGNEEFIQEFLVECAENLDQLDQDLVALEGNPRDPDRLGSIFRTIHTVKGTSGFFAYAKLGAVAHAGENLLGRLRDGELILNPELTDALLQLVDTIREILAAIEQSGVEGDQDYSSVIMRLEVLAAQPAIAATNLDDPSESVAADQPPPQDSVEETVGPSVGEIVPPSEAQQQDLASVEVTPPSQPQPARDAPETVESDDSTASDARSGSNQSSGEDEPESETATPTAPSLGTIRVDVRLLNELMNQVGELVLVRNQIRPFADSIDDRIFGNALQQLDLITGDLQEGVMKTRMQPIGNLWTRLPRVVRDLAHSRGKQVQLEMHGHETELDRTLIEAIKDPLTHLVRNAVDHGIELPEARRQAGKPAAGSVVLRAFHEGGLVNIEISDDGAGIDPERVREKALHQGLISPEQARRMSAHQMTQLIFLPGLSTAERVTDISGRGVGMDVVMTNIERIGGSVTIDSRPGSGTTLRVKIPLTLAIIPALMVSAAGQRFAIPQVSLREIIALCDGASTKALESIGDALVYRLRGELLPLVRLSEVLDLSSDDRQEGDESTHVVVLQAIGQRFGLIVDGIARTEEIVVKPLHKTLAQIPVFSGATVLGDGRVALILDVVGLARTANVDVREQAARSEEGDRQEGWEDESSEFGDYLICEATPGHRVAVALSDVARLEEYAVGQIGAESGRPLVPYRDHLMHLIHVDGYHLPDTSSDTSIYVVVRQVGARHVGLIVHRILDVLPAAQSIDTSRKLVGLRGRTLIDGQVLDVVDIEALAGASGIDLSAAEEVS